MIYCVGCLRALFLALTSSCHLRVPDLALFFVFLFAFLFSILLLLLGQIGKKDIDRPLHEAPLVLPSSLVFRSFPKDYDVHNR